MELRSFKLRIWDRHVWIVPALDHHGCAFSGPGVTLRGADADAMFERARPLLTTLASFEPGIAVRSLSLDLERGRLLATLEPPTSTPGARPRVVRIDRGPALEMLLAVCGELLPALAGAAHAALARRPVSED